MVGLTACSSNPSTDGSAGNTDLKPLVGAELESQVDQNAEAFDLGIEIMGVEMGDTASSGDILSSETAYLADGTEIKPILYFGFDESALSEKNTAITKYYAEFLMSNPNKTVVLKGHTDERGTPEYNLALAERRASSVERVMMLFGVNAARIENISFGEEQPAAFEHTEGAWELNRRVEIQIQ